MENEHAADGSGRHFGVLHITEDRAIHLFFFEFVREGGESVGDDSFVLYTALIAQR